MGRKGFFFTVVVLVLLSFLIISVSMWSKVIEAKEGRAPQKYKAEAIALVLDELTDEKMSSFANISAHYALYRLDSHTYSDPPFDLRLNKTLGKDKPHFIVSVNRSIYELMKEGYAKADWNSPHYLNYSDEVEYNEAEYTLAGWEEALKSACREIKLNLSVGEMENFTFEQTDWWTVSVHFNIKVDVTSEDGSMKMSRNLTADASFSIVGFVDPMIACGSMVRGVDVPGCGYTGNGSWMAAERQVFFREDCYEFPEDASPILVEEGKEGKGWFFGNVTTTRCDFLDPNAKLKVLVTDYFDEFDGVKCDGVNISLSQVADLFGGVIIIEEPGQDHVDESVPGCNYTRYWQTNCLDCLEWNDNQDPPNCIDENRRPYKNEVNVSFIAADIGNVDNWLDTNFPADKYVQRHILFDNEHEEWTGKRSGYHRIWNMESLRDLVLCGYYVKVDDAPSFLQRFTKKGYKLKGGNNFGIETFVDGLWAGGPLDETSLPPRDRDGIYSRVGHVFYGKGVTEIDRKMRIKGMPGCKFKDMCTLDGVPDDYKAACLGRFAMERRHMESYSLNDEITKIMCGVGSSCDR